MNVNKKNKQNNTGVLEGASNSAQTATINKGGNKTKKNNANNLNAMLNELSNDPELGTNNTTATAIASPNNGKQRNNANALKLTNKNKNVQRTNNKANGNAASSNAGINAMMNNIAAAANTAIGNSSSAASAVTSSNSSYWTIVKIIGVFLVVVLLLWLCVYGYRWHRDNKMNTVDLLDGNKNAKHALVISQDPANPSYTPMLRSDDRETGIQFSYSFWFYIDGLEYKKGEWKHIMHKGNSSSYPNRAPGVWIHPTSNILRIYMNTHENILEYIDIDNIPLRKWVNTIIILSHQNLDIYINGFLKERKTLSSLPKQNDDDFWINMFGGFDGFVSNVKYYSHAIEYDTIDGIVQRGPSTSNCIDTKEVPPYLDDSWWLPK